MKVVELELGKDQVEDQNPGKPTIAVRLTADDLARARQLFDTGQGFEPGSTRPAPLTVP